MTQILQIPEWLGAALAGALIAAVGYVAKLILEWVGAVNERRRVRRARLVALYSLLRAGEVAFLIQEGHRDELTASIQARDPVTVNSLIVKGYDHLFARAYPGMTQDEKELHEIIRTITENTIRPINELLLQWVREDDYFKAQAWGHGPKAELATNLSLLEAHLLLWFAKYKVWIPDQPTHALVYLADEKNHGVGFPKGLQPVVESILKKGW
jgi:hypothetical protein